MDVRIDWVSAPADIADTWTGSFSCSDSCCDGFDGEVILTITLNGESASHSDDGGASFTGTVCGNVYTFEGGGEGFTEGGRFVLNADGTASKQSTFTGLSEPFCTGLCMDELTRE